MPNSSDGEHDSRTASVGVQRTRRGTSNDSSRRSSLDKPNAKRQRRNGKSDTREVQDFVPRGASFSANSLQVDPDSTSSSGSDSESDSSSGSASSSGGDDDESSSSDSAEEYKPTQAPAGGWNKGSKSGIRTSLRSRNQTNGDDKTPTQFDAVNDKFWRSRSDSASSGGGDSSKSRNENGKKEDPHVSEEGELEEDHTAESSQMHMSGDSDESDSVDSEADDSILLNIGSRDEDQSISGQRPKDDGYDPEQLPLSEPRVNGDAQNGVTNNHSKEEAFRRFSQKYPMTPSTLADLERDDMERQARCLFYGRDINDISLQLPIACTECSREGHLAEVCPSRECVHCGAWNQHQSSFCPQWRRCQRCRDRGHDEAQCSSQLKGSAAETPCDLCGSTEHLELQCDAVWKIPRQDAQSGPVLVSLSCSHCTSNRHLIGDCPSLPKPLMSSSWTLKGVDPNMVTNTNSVVSGRAKGPSSRGSQRGGLKIRGRADQRSPSPDSDDMMSRPRQPIGRGAPRGNIRIGGGIGRNKNFAPAGPRAPEPSYHGGYRSRSPPRPGRGRGRDSYHPGGPRSPPGRPRHPLPPRPGRGGGGDRGGRGSYRGGGPGPKRGGGGGGDAYRPLPSAGKKAWDRYRL